MSGAGGTWILSIDLELDLDQHGRQPADRQLDAARNHLVKLTQELELPATWAVADPLFSAATESILSAGVGHEIAVRGERSWLGTGCGRSRLARELERRFVIPRKFGIPVTTLALRNLEQVGDRDLLVEHGITAICPPPLDRPELAAKAVQPIRFGIWQPTPAWRIPPQRAWWQPAGWLIRRQMLRAVKEQSLLHLRLDMPRLVAVGDRALSVAASLLSYVAAKREAGDVAVSTICELAREALARREGLPSRSILKPAA